MPPGTPLAERAFWQGQGYPSWTDGRMLEAYGAVCQAFGPVWIGSCFKRAGRGQSAHYAGLAVDMGHDLSKAQRAELCHFCLESPLFSYVEPAYLTPTWVHAEISIAPSCAPGRGFPFLLCGDSGPHVFLLQDLLTRGGFSCLLTGHFSPETRRALLAYQKHHGLEAHGYADTTLWSHITH